MHCIRKGRIWVARFQNQDRKLGPSVHIDTFGYCQSDLLSATRIMGNLNAISVPHLRT
jgi:hypothetical protein